jgi:para-nitrobenzyl esterase
MQCAAVCGVGRSAFMGLAKCKPQVTTLAVAARALLTVAGAERGGPQARMGAAARQGMSKGGVCAFLGIIAMTFIGSQTAADEIQVKTAAGILSGSAQNGVESFKGIPFAAPPVGQLRWRAPQPLKPWKGVRLATNDGNDCQQTPWPGNAAPLNAPLSEDCLYLNVWRPAGSEAGAKLPVMVWIHGGAFTNGGASASVFAGDSFVRKGVIMVGINYRLGRFGFFGFPELSKQDKDHGLLGNYGYMDQITALTWVQRNIAAFGGDPGNVTSFGESAGGISVHVLLTSPLSRGLFTRAIVQSGGGRENMMGDRAVKVDRPGWPSLNTLGLAFARKHGITGSGATALAELRALPAAAVDDGLGMGSYPDPPQPETYGGPAVDGRIVVSSPQEAYLKDKQAKVALIIGATNADFGMPDAKTKEGVLAAFGKYALQAQALYDPDGQSDTDSVISTVSADRTMVEPARFVAAEFRRQGLPAYVYRFSYVANSMASEWKSGAPHATEVPYIMNTVAAKYGDKLTAKDAKIADVMNSYWANFAKTGNPNGPGLPAWPIYDSTADQIMDFAADGEARAVKDPWKARLDLVESTH